MARDAKAAGRAVSARMAEQQLTAKVLAAKSHVDVKTLRDLITGTRWPQHATRGRIEEALDWPFGHIEAIAEGSVPPADDPAAYVSSGGDEQPDAMDDAEVLELVKAARRLADELERRIGTEPVDSP